MKIKAFGHVKNGKLYISNRREFDYSIGVWKDCNATITVQSTTKGRSTNQNAYYWKVIEIIAAELREQHGIVYKKEDTHEFLKAKFNSVEVANFNTGQIEIFPISTTTLTTVEFEEYLENIRRWAEDFLNTKIPLPNEQVELFNPK